MNVFGRNTRGSRCVATVIAASGLPAVLAGMPAQATTAAALTISVSNNTEYEAIRDCFEPPPTQCHRFPGVQYFVVSLSAPSGSIVTVQYATANGTATTADYVTKSGTATFQPGQTSVTVSVSNRIDQVTEPTEAFALNLSNPNVPAMIANAGTGTILNGTGS